MNLTLKQVVGMVKLKRKEAFLVVGNMQKRHTSGMNELCLREKEMSILTGQISSMLSLTLDSLFLWVVSWLGDLGSSGFHPMSEWKPQPQKDLWCLGGDGGVKLCL